MNEQALRKKLDPDLRQELGKDYQMHIAGADCNFQLTLISAAFEGQNTLARHRRIQPFLKADIASGALHAVSLKTYTPTEYAQR